MADPDNTKLGYRPTTRSLKYGDLGQLLYERRAHTWVYTRNDHPDITDLGKDEKDGEDDIACPHLISLTSRPCTNEADRPLSEKGASAALPRRLGVSAPEVSAWLETKSTYVNPDSKSSLERAFRIISFGSATCLSEAAKQSAIRYMPISAYTTGDNNDTLILACLETTSLHDPDARRLPGHPSAPCIGQGTTTRWRTSGGAIQDLTFSRRSVGSMDDSWLAVRQSSCTTILHPLLSRFPEPQSHTPTSPLVSNPIVTLPISHTGGHIHTDVAFHPRNPRILAIVDTHGTWSVWKLKGKRQRTLRVLHRLHLLSTGTIDNVKWDDQSGSDHNDNWYRLSWVVGLAEGSDQLLLCGRRLAVLVQLSDHTLGFVDLQLGPPRTKTWILDVQQCILTPYLFFFLTSESISAVRFFPEVFSTVGESASELECSWNHYRNPLDRSLRINLVEKQEGCTVLLQSYNNNLITRFAFAQSRPTATPGIVSTSDPKVFELPRTLLDKLTLGKPGLPRLVVRPICLTFARQTEAVSYSYIKLFAINSASELIEAIFAFERILPGSVTELDPRIGFRNLPRQLLRTPKLIEDDELDDFIVPDGIKFDTLSISADPSGGHTQSATRSHLRSTSSDLSRACAYIATTDNTPQTQWMGTLQAALKSLNQATLADPARRLLSELVSSNPGVVEVEEVFSTLDASITATTANNSVSDSMQLLNILSHHDDDTASVTTTKLYSDFVDIYLQQLPDHIPNRARVHRERVVRQLALTLMLSSFLMLESESPPAVEDALSPLPDINSSLPAMGFLPTSSQQPRFSQPQSPTSSSIPDPPEGSDPVSRLQRYTTFHSPPSPPSIFSTSSIHRILSHYPPTLHQASSYSYANTQLQLSLAQAQSSLAELDPKARRRATRLAEIGQRRMARQAELNQRISQQNAMLPEVAVSVGRDVQSSQGPGVRSSQRNGVPDVGVTMTQPERGAHGARPKRKAGF